MVVGWLLTGWTGPALDAPPHEVVRVQQLVECHMLSSTEESELLGSLSFAPEDAWLPLLYRSSLLHTMHTCPLPCRSYVCSLLSYRASPCAQRGICMPVDMSSFMRLEVAPGDS